MAMFTELFVENNNNKKWVTRSIHFNIYVHSKSIRLTDPEVPDTCVKISKGDETRRRLNSPWKSCYSRSPMACQLQRNNQYLSSKF